MVKENLLLESLAQARLLTWENCMDELKGLSTRLVVFWNSSRGRVKTRPSLLRVEAFSARTGNVEYRGTI